MERFTARRGAATPTRLFSVNDAQVLVTIADGRTLCPKETPQ